MRILVLAFALTVSALAADKPNILWLTFEDSSPHLGCYGDPNANTPNFDALAKQGMRYHRAWSNAPVCAPARTCIISGRWAPANGAEHMRSEVAMPAGMKMFPQLLREAGYYCTNNAKEDYNLTKPEGVWDESSKNAHWKNRKDGQPFFAVFNHEKSHESQIRAKPHTLIHDPAKVIVPRYMPDTPEVRHDWAQHFDNVTTVDGQIAAKIKEMRDAGLADDTIIFTFADHGTGMPRSKRWPYDSGLRVPFIVYFPEKWKHLAPKDYKADGVSERLISFIDLAPTVLSIAGIKPPDYLHGQAFAGAHPGEDRGVVFGFRGRMDERIDCTRSVTDGRFIYIRHFMPHLPEGQHVNYMFEQATTQVWYDLFKEGRLNDFQQAFWKEKPQDELFDLDADPWETENLNQNQTQEYMVAKQRLSMALTQFMITTRDLGLMPEGERLAASKGKSPHDVFADDKAFPYVEVLKAAMLASDRSYPDPVSLLPLLKSDQAAIRYWGALGSVMRGERAVQGNPEALMALLDDKSTSVRTAAAEALAQHGNDAAKAKAWEVLLANANAMNGSAITAAEALNAIDRLGDAAKAHKDQLAAMPLAGPEADPARIKEYPVRLMEYMSKTVGFDMPKREPKARPGKGKKGKAADQ
jgi:uncharacterized sulfatase